MAEHRVLSILRTSGNPEKNLQAIQNILSYL